MGILNEIRKYNWVTKKRLIQKSSLLFWLPILDIEFNQIINNWLHCVSKSDIFIFNVFDYFGLPAAVGYDRPLKIEFICIGTCATGKIF